MTNIEAIEELTHKLNTVEAQEVRWQRLLEKGGIAIAVLAPSGKYVEANQNLKEKQIRL